MTIYLYSGTPGTGKSLHAANDIRFQLNRRRPHPVIGNFELSQSAPVRHPEFFSYYPNEDLTPDLLTTHADNYWDGCGHDFKEDYLTLVLDECQ